ncbi:hypothetical protein GCM10027428_19000 [Haliea atlantica]
MVTTILLIFIEAADVGFGDSVSFLGATLSIGNPEFIHHGVLVFQIYFLWRFYQYFSTDNAYGVLISQYKEYIESKTSIAIVRLICKPKDLKGLSGEYKFEDLKSKDFFKYHVDAAIIDNKKSYDPETIKFEAEISKIRVLVSRFMAFVTFIFRGRILTDYFVPYLLVVISVGWQFL